MTTTLTGTRPVAENAVGADDTGNANMASAGVNADNINTPPVFEQDSYSKILAENVAIGDEVASISATAADDQTLTYSITSGNDQELFAIDKTTGKITIADVNVRYELASYTLTVQVTDSLEGIDTARLVINNPVVGNPLIGYGTDSKDTFLSTDSVHVIYGYGGHDRFYGDPPHRTYDDLIYYYDDNTFYGGSGHDKMYGGSGHDNLYGGSGNDYLHGDIGNDYLYGGSGTNVLYGGEGADIFVMNTDGSSADTVNDFRPHDDKIRVYFDDPSSISTLEELYAAAGLRVSTGNIYVDAIYLLTDNFSIQNIGIYKIVGNADNSDNGESDDALLMVLEDFETALEFDMFDVAHLHSATIAETIAIGSKIIKVAPSDADTDATLTYVIEGGNEDDLFTIDSNTGQITLAGMLDYETATKHILTVQITDSVSSTTDTVEVLINVADANDAPVFSADSYSKILAETATIGSVAVSVVATDSDGDALTYSITEGNDLELFAIDNDGNITLAVPDEMTSPTLHTLTVQVTDSTGRTDTAAVTITDSAYRGTDSGERFDIFNARPVYGYGGDDRLFGRRGDDTLHGGNGADFLRSLSGDDILYGGNDDDILYGGDDDDVLYGGAGSDILYGERGDDKFNLDITRPRNASSSDETNTDIIADFSREGYYGIDTLRIDSVSGDEASFAALNLRVEEVANKIIEGREAKYNDMSAMDSVIYHTGGTADDTTDDIALLILEDFTGLTFAMVEVV